MLVGQLGQRRFMGCAYFFRVSGSIGWITLSMIGCRRDEDCLLWDEDLHDVIPGCFMGGFDPSARSWAWF